MPMNGTLDHEMAQRQQLSHSHYFRATRKDLVRRIAGFRLYSYACSYADQARVDWSNMKCQVALVCILSAVKQNMPKRRCSSAFGEPAAKKTRSPAQALVQKVEKCFRENANTADAEAMKKYMRGQFEFFGLKSPQRKALGKDFLQEKLEPPEIRELVKLLWQQPERELQYFALDYIEKHIKTFADNPDDFDASVSCIKDMIAGKSRG